MKHIKSLCFIILGNFLLALGISVFLLPANFVSGGATGLGIILNHYFGFPIPVCILFLNLILLVIGFFFLGRRFLATTILSSILYPVFLQLLENAAFLPDFQAEPLLLAIYAGLLVGLGLGLVFKEGASTGGTDIPVLILNRKLGVSLEMGLYITDGLVILGQAIFTEPKNILYGLLVVILSSFVIGRIEVHGRAQIQLLIVSPEYLTIREQLLHQLDTGVTLLNIETGLQRAKTYAVLTVIPRRKLMDTTKLVQGIDANAFIMIHEIKEVRGRGYTLNRDPMKP